MSGDDMARDLAGDRDSTARGGADASRVTGQKRGLIAAAFAFVTVTCVMFAASGPAAADHACRGDEWPPFRAVSQTAKRVVVGTVVEGEGGTFRLRIDEVLRGSAGETLEISGLRSGLPARVAAGCNHGSVLLASFGDQIAIAFKGKMPGARKRLTSAAWIHGRPSYGFNPGLERMTLAQVRRLAGHAADGKTLLPDRGITRSPVGFTEAAHRVSRMLAGLDRTIRDNVARHACAAVLNDIPRMEVRSGEPELAAAYKMTGPELFDYFAFRARMLGPDRSTPVSTAWRDVLGTVDACFIDGDLEAQGLSAPDQSAKRVLVLIDDRGPVLWYVAGDRKGELPLLFEFLR